MNKRLNRLGLPGAWVVVVAGLVSVFPATVAQAADQAVEACTQHAKWHAEAVVKRSKANGEPYDAVAIGSVRQTKGDVSIVDGSVDIYTDIRMFEFNYSCRYDADDTSSRITDLERR